MPKFAKRTAPPANDTGIKPQVNKKNKKKFKSDNQKLGKTLEAIEKADKTVPKEQKGYSRGSKMDAEFSKKEENLQNSNTEGDSSSEDENHTEQKVTGRSEIVSVDEMYMLNQTPKMYKSNIFKLQIEEVIKENRIVPFTSRTKKLEAFLKQITSVINSSKRIKPSPLKQAIQDLHIQAKKNNHSSIFCYPDPCLKIPNDTKHTLVEYIPPTKVAVVGSYPLGLSTITRNGFNVDIAVQMPNELFVEKDYINYRYFYKRSYYLSCLIYALNNDVELSKNMEFSISELRGDSRLPIIVGFCKKIDAAKSNSLIDLKFCIRIIPCISSALFSKNKLSPTKNNVRPNFLFTAFNDEHKESFENELYQSNATPKYNSAIISDSKYFIHMNYLHELCKESPGFKDAVVLAKVWLSQRGFDKSRFGLNSKTNDLQRETCVNGFLLTFLISWLIKGSRSQDTKKFLNISSGLSSFQIFKNLMIFLSQFVYSSTSFGLEFSKVGSLESNSKKNSDNIFSVSEFLKTSNFVFTDPIGDFNLLSRSNSWELKRLGLEASKTLNILNSGNEEDGFFPIFMHNVDEPLLAYDHVFKMEFDIKTDFIYKELYKGFDRNVVSGLNWKLLDEANATSYLESKIVRVIESGLGNRAKLVEVRSACVGENALKNKNSLMYKSSKEKDFVFFVGIILNPTEMVKLVALGPQPSNESDQLNPNNLEAKKFETLWGSKSEIRRFRDGTIRLSTLWGSGNASAIERSAIVPKMVFFLMNRHFGLTPMGRVLDSEDLKISKLTKANDLNLDFCTDLTESISGSCKSVTLYLEKYLQSVEESEALDNEKALYIGQPVPEPFLDYADVQKIYVEWSKKVLKISDNLPLSLISVRTTSPFIRETSVTMPKQTFGKDDAYLDSIDIIIEFESSTKWPDDIMAMQKVKTSFLQAFGDAYTKEFQNSEYHIISRNFGHSQIGKNYETLLSGVGPVTTGSSSGSDCCDLLASEQDLILEIMDNAYSGFIFRVFLKLDREKSYYERLIKKYNSPLLDSKTAALKNLKIQTINSYINHWNRIYESRVNHHYLISSFSKNFYPAFSQTCRLFKRWLACHNLFLESGQGYISNSGVHGVPEELSELIVAYIFLNKANDYKNYATSPSSVSCAFNRVLELLCNYNFNELPLLVDLGYEKNLENSEQEKVDWTDSISYFETLKKSKGFGGIYIATTIDSRFNSFGYISSLVYNRIRSLAKASMSLIITTLETSDLKLLSKAFVSSYSAYDFSLTLDSEFCSRMRQNIIPQLFNSEYLITDNTEESDIITEDKKKEKASDDENMEINMSEYKNLELAKLQSFENGSKKSADQPESSNGSLGSIQNNPLMKNRYSKLNLKPNPFGLERMVSFDPVALFRRDLELIYHKHAVFFHNNFGGNVIYGLWKPAVQNIQKQMPILKPNLHMNVIPVEGSDKNITVNKESILEEMHRIGEGLVTKVKAKD
ncbi:hypothetical protein BB561_002594 [Smittium simulii]|uniref:Nucleolar protein 6 n=1 Tax=Smittium simulii TaxID=133385 RepID=A0A2T9YPU4_9FUNG|nr:hypothetical protein BB561_002594 [Smittium simulii]